jgi:peptide-methionine (R)-S-oxide reductase
MRYPQPSNNNNNNGGIYNSNRKQEAAATATAFPPVAITAPPAGTESAVPTSNIKTTTNVIVSGAVVAAKAAVFGKKGETSSAQDEQQVPKVSNRNNNTAGRVSVSSKAALLFQHSAENKTAKEEAMPALKVSGKSPSTGATSSVSSKAALFQQSSTATTPKLLKRPSVLSSQFPMRDLKSTPLSPIISPSPSEPSEARQQRKNNINQLKLVPSLSDGNDNDVAPSPSSPPTPPEVVVVLVEEESKRKDHLPPLAHSSKYTKTTKVTSNESSLASKNSSARPKDSNNNNNNNNKPSVGNTSTTANNNNGGSTSPPVKSKTLPPQKLDSLRHTSHIPSTAGSTDNATINAGADPLSRHTSHVSSGRHQPQTHNNNNGGGGHNDVRMDGKPLAHWDKSNFQLERDETCRFVLKPKEEDFFAKTLTTREYDALRKTTIEQPYFSKYNRFFPRSGHFCCKACGNALFSHATKFNAYNGWPAFGGCVEGAVELRHENELGESVIEILCHACKSHLGNVLLEENRTPTGIIFHERHRVNGTSLKYIHDDLSKRIVVDALVLVMNSTQQRLR